MGFMTPCSRNADVKKCAPVISSVFASLMILACASHETSADGDEQDITAGKVRPELVGSFEDKNQRTQDFGSLVLMADGTYSAQVLANVVHSTILCNRLPCNAPEAGRWTATATKLRLAPGQSPVRIYRVSQPFDGPDLHLERGSSVQDLHFVGAPRPDPAACCGEGSLPSGS